jgi:prevent-host-death family protein
MLNTYLDMCLIMQNIFPITDLQRQSAQILEDLQTSSEPFVITQRGRASAVLISAKRFEQIEKDLKMLDEIELLHLVEEAKKDIEAKNTISHEEVKKRLNYSK